MVMTAAVIEELSGLGHTRTCCWRAEVATLLRFAGAVHVVAGQVVISAEVDGAGVAGWLRKAIRETFGYPSDVRVLPTAVGRPSGARYLMRVLATVRHWAAKPVSWTSAGARSGGCPRTWWPVACVMPKPCGGQRFWPAAPSPTGVVPRPWK